MGVPSAYLTSTKNAAEIFGAIQRASVPSTFTYEFLKQLGYASSGDRPIIPVLKAIGFLSESSQPTELYRRYKDKSIAKAVMAQGLREGYKDVFAIDTEAHNKSSTELSGIFARISEKGESVTNKMAATFKILSTLADFSAESVTPDTPPAGKSIPTQEVVAEQSGDLVVDRARDTTLTLRHDVHVHLPATTDVAVYDAIFRSLRANIL